MAEEMAELVLDLYERLLWCEGYELRNSPYNDLTVKELRALTLLSQTPHQTAQSVAYELRLTPGSFTATADHLVEKGYITRKKDPQDRRVSRLDLTKKGEAVAQLSLEYRLGAVKHITNDFTPEEMAVCKRCLRRGIKLLENEMELTKAKTSKNKSKS